MSHVLYQPEDFTAEELDSNLAKMVIEGGLSVCMKCGAAEADLERHASCQVHNNYKAFIKGYVRESNLEPLEAEKAAEQLWESTYKDISSRIESAEASILELQRTKINQLEEQLNEAYRQRGVVVVGLAALAMAKGYEVCRREPTETEWPVLYIELPQGQVSWHFNIKDDHMIERFPINNDKEWDGKFSGREVEFMLKALDY